MRYLAVDLGSTYTKLAAIDSTSASIVATAAAFTTIEHDVMDGFREAYERLQVLAGGFEYDKLLCCSSAAGGLAMVAVGLVPSLTAKAARMAAESAGAKVIRTYSYELSEAEKNEICSINPDIVLLSGGTDGGNKETLVNNARMLCGIDRPFAVIAAGNKSAMGEVESVLRGSGKQYLITENVMPTFGLLNIAPARACVRDIFIRRIIEAKGLSRIQEMSEYEIVPTPLAVLRACELLCRGTGDNPGIGEFMAVDLGGATTDVYSMAEGEPGLDNVMVKGLPEPFAKRTVEGDLGMRYSLPFLLEAAGAERIASEAGVGVEDVENWVEKCVISPDTVAPEDTGERLIDETLARFAIALAVERHCGVLERNYTPMGECFVLKGKDLTGIRKVIGVGGILVNSRNPGTMLAGAVSTHETRAAGRAMPASPEFYLDKKYIFSAMGLLGQLEPDLALTLMMQQLQAVPGECRVA